VLGTFSQASNATLVVTVDPSANAGGRPLLAISGCADVSGTLDLALNNSLANDTSVPVLSSPCLSGTFSNVVLSGPGATCAAYQGQSVDAGTLSVLLRSSGCGGLSTGAIIALAVGGGILIVATLAAATLLLYRWKRPHSRLFGYGADDGSDYILQGNNMSVCELFFFSSSGIGKGTLDGRAREASEFALFFC
jgi:hypothetical protein